jgi:predicted NBD/HSP70 family sugar kinase
LLRLDAARPRFLAVHLGVSETLLAALPVAIRSEDHWVARFQTPGSVDEWIEELRVAAEPLLQKDLWGVLVSVPGIVDERVGRVVFSPNLQWTSNIDLQELIRRVWDLPVLLVQEERALALGHHAAVPEHEDFLLVDFGEGVGGAAVVAGKIYSSPLPISGELGHTPVLGNWRPCGCGAAGCVETLVSTRGLVQSFALASPNESPTWSGFVCHIAEHGVTPWLAEALNAAGVVIAGALNAFGLGRVVFTGSLTELAPEVIEHLAQTVQQGTMWARFGQVECLAAVRRRSAGLVAVGIDRLVIPVSESREQAQSSLIQT